MSLLPQQIIPQSTPLGRIRENGEVIIDHNWWLLLYNLCQQVLGINGSLPADAIQDLASADADAVDTDAIALRAPLDELAQLIPNEGPPAPTFQDFANAVILATDVLLQDSSARAQPVNSITVGGSPYTYTAAFDGAVSVSSGTVSNIAIVRQGTSVATGVTAGVFPVRRLDQLIVTYSSTPTMVFLP